MEVLFQGIRPFLGLLVSPNLRPFQLNTTRCFFDTVLEASVTIHLREAVRGSLIDELLNPMRNWPLPTLPLWIFGGGALRGARGDVIMSTI